MEYTASRRLLLAAEALIRHRNGGAPAVLLEGPPGAGKTAFGEWLAAREQMALVFHQCHAWTDVDELFVGVDVAAAVAGDAEAVRQDGVLARAARLSQQDRVLVLLDEIDKTSERAEALLLDWLQSGRVPLRPGLHLQTRLDNIAVVLTSNGVRQLSDALLRRVRRVQVDPLPVELLDRLAVERSGAPAGVVTLISRACREVARAEGNLALSLQEISHAAREAWELAQDVADVREILAAWAARTAAGRGAAAACRLAPAIWSEIKLRRAHV